MRMFKLLVGAAMLAGASQANAQATYTFTGAAGVQPGETLLASFDGGVPTYGGITGTYLVQSGSNTSGADPFVTPRGDPYLSVLGGQSASFSFAGLSSIGLDYGSADPYNTFILSFLTGSPQIVTGTMIVASADGNQTAARTNGRLTFTATGTNYITGLTLRSSSNSLEADNIGVISAVPEPGVWAMMLMGFGAIGAAMRRRRRNGAPSLLSA